MSKVKPRQQRGLRADPQAAAPVWGEGERPSWLAPEQDQPKKREWSPARDRMEAEMELRARLEEQRRLRRRSTFKRVFLPAMWVTSLAMAVVDVGRRSESAVGPAGPRPGGPTALDSMPAGVARVPGARPLPAGWPPPPPPSPESADGEDHRPAASDLPPGETTATRDASEIGTAPLDKPSIVWPESVEPSRPTPGAAPPKPPDWDWRPVASPPEAAPQAPEQGRAEPPAEIHADWATDPAPHTEEEPSARSIAAEPGEAEGALSEEPATEAPADRSVPPEPIAADVVAAAPSAAPHLEPSAPPAAAAAPPAAAPPAAPSAAPPGFTEGAAPTVGGWSPPADPRDVAGSILSTCVRASEAQVGVLTLLQDDNLVVRACSGVSNEVGAKLALDVVSDICLEVIASGQPFRASSPSSSASRDPYTPLSLLCVPVPLGIAQAGVVLLTGYLPDHPFTEEHQRLVTTLASHAAPQLVDAGAFALEVTPGGDAWRRLEEVAAQPPNATQVLGSPWRRAEPETSAPVSADSGPMPSDTPGEEDRPGPATPAQAKTPADAEQGVTDLESAPLRTMNLDAALVSRIIADVKAARADHQASSAPDTPPPSAAAAPPPSPPPVAPAPVASAPPPVAPAPPPVAPAPPPVSPAPPPIAPAPSSVAPAPPPAAAEPPPLAPAPAAASAPDLASAPPETPAPAPAEPAAAAPDVAGAPSAVSNPAAPSTTAEEPSAPGKKRSSHHGLSWARQVRTRMGQIQKQRVADQQRERAETLAAVRSLSWDGYQALIADIFRRKAFEVFPPPSSGADLDVIDMVVDRDDRRMLVNCQLRNIEEVPLAAVTEMSSVVYNYSVAGAYLITDGHFEPQATEYAEGAGIVLIDADALVDLVVETTLVDERKPTVGRRLAGAFGRRH